MNETAAERVSLKDVPDSDVRFDAKELSLGIEVELEHTTDPAVAKKIAKHHLLENPNYYTKILLPAEAAADVKKSTDVMKMFAREIGLIQPVRDDRLGGVDMTSLSPLALLAKSRSLIQPTPVPSGRGAPAPSRKETRKKVGKQHGASTGIHSPEPNPAPGGNQVNVTCPHCKEGFAINFGTGGKGKGGGKYGPAPGKTSSSKRTLKAMDMLPNTTALLKSL
jgi:hypothetical protein